MAQYVVRRPMILLGASCLGINQLSIIEMLLLLLSMLCSKKLTETQFNMITKRLFCSLIFYLVTPVLLSVNLKGSNVTEIKIGIILAQTIAKEKDVSTWRSGDFYASAFLVARDEINNNSHLLPRHRLEYVYNDTKCLDDRAIRLLQYQVFQRNVVGIIGFGCSRCDCLAKYASAFDIMIVSHVSDNQ